MKHQPDNPMRCRSVSLSCKGKINHLIRLPIIPCTGIRKDFGSALALPPITWRTEHDWESGTLTAETIDAGYISIILEI
uniref:Mobile mystery protein B n=2 Tax=Enterobacteriaceae TaxID=543 RepID=A0A3G4RKZ4_ECOLX|nr:mobile mystery protein B [Escherichia coli]AYU66629.1 mobile mystery protein B [Salmonella enterica subsp. enterica serovar Anatum]